MTSKKCDRDRMIDVTEFLVATHPELLRKVSAKFDIAGDVASIDVEFANGLDGLLPSLEIGDRDALCIRVRGSYAKKDLYDAAGNFARSIGCNNVKIFDDSVSGVFVLRRAMDEVVSGG